MTNKDLAIIETKLSLGVQTFSATDVAALLNTIRIQKATIKKFIKGGTN